MKSVSIPHWILFGTSLTLNSFLLQLIARKSSKEMSLYKYLLFVFIFNDLLYTIIHFVVHPIISITGEVFYLYSANFPGRFVVTIFGTSHSHSFFILAFHFIYRYIAYASTNGNRLFRQWWFIALLVLIFILESILWFLGVYYLYATDRDTFLEIYEVVHEEYPQMVAPDMILTAHYWRPDGGIRWRPLLGTGALTAMMTIVLAIVLYSAIRIHKLLHHNLSKSIRGLALQRQLYYTLLVQFCVPFFVMYVPVFFAIFPPLLHIRLTFPGYLMPTMFSVYPALDALVILFGVHDYRREVLAVFKCFYPAPYVGNSVVTFTTMSVQK